MSGPCGHGQGPQEIGYYHLNGLMLQTDNVFSATVNELLDQKTNVEYRLSLRYGVGGEREERFYDLAKRRYEYEDTYALYEEYRRHTPKTEQMDYNQFDETLWDREVHEFYGHNVLGMNIFLRSQRPQGHSQRVERTILERIRLGGYAE